MGEDLEKNMTPKLIGGTYLKKATPISPQRYRFGIYKCQYCGKEFECITRGVTSGNTKSCGCQRGRWFKHGLESHRFYSTWNNMIQRCTSPNHRRYKDYGGRGITVCEEWLDVKNFVAWAESTHPNIEGYSLDRIDNDKGYYPENCRWADRITQNNNQRKRNTNTSGYVGVTSNGANWTARIMVNNKRVGLGIFLTKEEAVQARDNYIIENKLPHKLSADY